MKIHLDNLLPNLKPYFDLISADLASASFQLIEVLLLMGRMGHLR